MIENYRRDSRFAPIRDWIERHPFRAHSIYPLCTVEVDSNWYASNTVALHLDQLTDQASRRVKAQIVLLEWAVSCGVSFSGAEVLDLYSGVGALWDGLRSFNCRSYVGVDINASLVAIANARFVGDHRLGGDRANFVHADALAFSASATAFDIVFVNYETLNTLLHGELLQLGKSVSQILRPGGYLIGDVRTRPQSAFTSPTGSVWSIDSPFFSLPNICVDECGFRRRGTFWGHRFTAITPNSSSITVRHNFLRLLEPDEWIDVIEGSFECQVVRSARLLASLGTDVAESKDNIFFVGRRSQR